MQVTILGLPLFPFVLRREREEKRRPKSLSKMREPSSLCYRCGQAAWEGARGVEERPACLCPRSSAVSFKAVTLRREPSSERLSVL